MSVVKYVKTAALSLIVLLSFCSCGISGELFIGEGTRANALTEEIRTAIENKDKESLKSLFSEKAKNDDTEIDDEISDLFELIQGDIESCERGNYSSSKTDSNSMLRFGFDLKTNKDIYSFFVIDYYFDSLNPDNQGLYMLELILPERSGVLGSWQERMRAGVYIH